MVVKKIGAADERDIAMAIKPRQMSGTGYPYFALAESMEAVDAIHRKGGGMASPDQVAAWLGYSTVNSGTFATRLSSARQFQLLEPQPIEGKLVITERAKTILAPVMPGDKINALVDAFLSVPLFRSLFERFRGSVLPPDDGLRNLLEHNYKIIPDRVAQALRVFKESADYAGFFKEGPNRLIRPSAHASAAPIVEKPTEPSVAAPRVYGGDVGIVGAGGVDTAIIGLLRKLPAPGESWTGEEQKRFLTAFSHTIEFLYPVKKEAGGA